MEGVSAEQLTRVQMNDVIRGEWDTSLVAAGHLARSDAETFDVSTDMRHSITDAEDNDAGEGSELAFWRMKFPAPSRRCYLFVRRRWRCADGAYYGVTRDATGSRDGDALLEASGRGTARGSACDASSRAARPRRRVADPAGPRGRADAARRPAFARELHHERRERRGSPRFYENGSARSSVRRRRAGFRVPRGLGRPRGGDLPGRVQRLAPYMRALEEAARGGGSTRRAPEEAAASTRPRDTRACAVGCSGKDGVAASFLAAAAIQPGARRPRRRGGSRAAAVWWARTRWGGATPRRRAFDALAHKAFAHPPHEAQARAGARPRPRGGSQEAADGQSRGAGRARVPDREEPLTRAARGRVRFFAIGT